MKNPFRYFNSSPEAIRLTVMLYIRYPLSLRQVEGILFERGIDTCHETVRLQWNRFGPMFAAEIRKRRVQSHSYSRWRWHLDEVFVRINGETYYLWRAVDPEGEALEVFATKRRDRKGFVTGTSGWIVGHALESTNVEGLMRPPSFPADDYRTHSLAIPPLQPEPA